MNRATRSQSTRENPSTYSSASGMDLRSTMARSLGNHEVRLCSKRLFLTQDMTLHLKSQIVISSYRTRAIKEYESAGANRSRESWSQFVTTYRIILSRVSAISDGVEATPIPASLK